MRSLKRRALILALGFAMSTVAAMGSCGAPQSNRSADASADGLHVQPDVVAPTDGAPDIEAGFLDGWVAAPWANPPCRVYQPASKDVLATVQPIKWQACTSGRMGCTEIVHDWVTKGSLNSIGGSWAEISGAEVMLVERDFGAGENEFLLYQDDVLVWAWRYIYTGLTGCLVGGFGPLSGVPLIQAIERDSKQNLTHYRQLVDSVPSTISAAAPTYNFDTSDAGFGGISSLSVASSSIVAMWAPQGGQVAIRDRGPNTLHTFYNDPTNYADDYPVVVEDSVFYANGGSGGQVFMYTPTSGMRVLRSSYADVTVHDVASDGANVAWTESTGSDGGALFASSKLYVSPYTHGSTALTPVVLDTDVCAAHYCPMAMSHGFLMVGGYGGQKTGTLYLYRLSDHTRWILTPLSKTDGLGMGGIIKDKLWVSSFAQGLSGIERIDIAALGVGQASW